MFQEYDFTSGLRFSDGSAQLLLRQLGIAPAAPVVCGLVEVLGVGPAAVPHLL